MLYSNRMTLRLYYFCDISLSCTTGQQMTWQNKRVISYLNGATKTSTPERINDFGKRKHSAVGSHLDLEATVAFP